CSTTSATPMRCTSSSWESASMTRKSARASSTSSAGTAVMSRQSPRRCWPSAKPTQLRPARLRARCGRPFSGSSSRASSIPNSTGTRRSTHSPRCHSQRSTERRKAREGKETEMFARWGRFVYRFRWATLVGSGVLLAVTVGGLLMGGTLQQGGPTVTNNIEAFKAGNLINTELYHGKAQVTSNFSLIFKSNTLTASDPAFKEAVTAALAPIESDPRITSIASPYNATSPQDFQALTSKDGHEALANIELKASGKQAWSDYNSLRPMVKSDTLSITGTGFVPINQAFNSTLENDLQRAEYVSLPITLLLLVIIFATLVAAGLPLGVGLLTIVGGL